MLPHSLLRPFQSTAAAAGLHIEELFRAHAALAPIFAAVGRDPAGLYTAQQAGEVAVLYAQQQRLDSGTSAATHILLDVTLCDALFKVTAGCLWGPSREWAPAMCSCWYSGGLRAADSH